LAFRIIFNPVKAGYEELLFDNLPPVRDIWSNDRLVSQNPKGFVWFRIFTCQ